MNSKELTSGQSPFVIGYWPIRYRAQVIRLLCEYLALPYVDKLYQHPDDWFRNRPHQQFQSWMFIDLPYLIKGDDHFTETIPIVNYIIKIANRTDLLGKTLEDQAQVDMFMWTIDSIYKKIGKLCCPNKSQQELLKEKADIWQNFLKEKLKFMELYPQPPQTDYFMGYLTVCDFFIYQLKHYCELIFTDSTKNCHKLKKIAQNVRKLPAINQYQQSEKAIKTWLPGDAFKRNINKHKQGSGHCRQ